MQQIKTSYPQKGCSSGTMYCLELTSYTCPVGELTNDHYGSLAEIADFITALKSDKLERIRYAKTIDAFEQYLAGNHAPQHLAGEHLVPILSQVPVLAENYFETGPYEWEHIAFLADKQFHFSAKKISGKQIIIKRGNRIILCNKPCFTGLRYRLGNRAVASVGDKLYGCPQLVVHNGTTHQLRLFSESGWYRNFEDALRVMWNPTKLHLKGACCAIFPDVQYGKTK